VPYVAVSEFLGTDRGVSGGGNAIAMVHPAACHRC